MIITLTGNAGAGKSTVRKILAERLGWNSYSMGDVQRKLAVDNNMTLAEWNAYTETTDDVDRMVDDHARKIGETEDNFIMDGWIAWNFIPHSLKVFLTVDPDVSAERIFKHAQEGARDMEAKYKSVEEVKAAVVERESSHSRRFKEYYDIQWDDHEKMDLVVDTTNISPEEVAQRIIDKLEELA